MEVCGYCGEPRGEKYGCCDENHWEEVDEVDGMNDRKTPKEIAQTAYDNGHVPTFLAALCTLIMCADPTPLTPEQDEAIRRGADSMAKKLGFTDWVEAYHGLNHPNHVMAK